MQFRKTSVSVIFWIVVVTTFFMVVSWAVLSVNGLRFDRASGQFVQTGLLAIESRLDEIELKINGQLVSTKTPYRSLGLLPGSYQVKISKIGYQPVEMNVLINGGQAKVIDNMYLIAVNPLGEATTEQYRVIEPLDVGITVENGEVFDNGNFVTRFSTNPTQFRRLQYGYVYQIGSELRLLIPNQGMDKLLYTNSSNELLKFNYSPSNWSVTIFPIDSLAETIYLLKSI